MLDGSVATLRALPEIRAAVGNRMTILMDGGVRRGSDVIKAVGLGADAVLIGRAYLYGLLAAGEPGVDRMLQLLQFEIAQTMAWLGVRSLDELDDSLFELPHTWTRWGATTNSNAQGA